MNEKILVVEDERDIARMIEYNLKKEGYRPVLVHDGSFAAALAAKEKPALILLDLMLPGLDGLEVCRRLKADAKTSAIPIIMLTAKGEESDKVLGLGLGADDYVTKPFSLKELLARVGAVLRRSSVKSAAGETPGKLKVGTLELDAAKVQARLKGEPLELTAKEFELLKALMACGDRVLTREELLEKAWGVDSSLEVETRTVDVHIGTLRRKLGKEGRRIVTVKNYGYRFEAE
ncbi:MAG TPA: DNA-binding response regulator [Elusimicrobia bacterium]|nr:MAG: DNA-binding response regulator [Elusimicrobia bacterium GWA2_64_40]HAN05533.1 DNA-binding response regulator [Elusimicrobiota bacterium]HAU89232.1 DNA-binding response regulator [Elusimicrobiota bacterium]